MTSSCTRLKNPDFPLYLQIKVKKIIKHEDYKGGDLNQRYGSPWTEGNDIALIRLEKPAKFGPNIIPVCLPSFAMEEVNLRCNYK